MVFKRLALSLIIFLFLSIVGIGLLPYGASAALAFHSGFENGNTFEWSGVTGSPTTVAAGAWGAPNTGSYALHTSTAAATAYVTWTTTVSIEAFSMYLFIHTAPDADVLILGNSAAENIKLTTARKIDLYGAAVKRASGTTVIPLDTWTRVSGSLSTLPSKAWVWINGNIEHNGVTQDFAIWATGASSLPVGITGAVTADLYFDDVVFWDGPTSSDIGDIRTLLSLPNVAGDLSEFDTPVGNTTAGYHYMNVNDAPGSISDADYNQHAAASNKGDLYGLQDSATIGIGTTETIQAVNSLYRMQRGGGSATVHDSSIKDNGTAYETSRALGTSYAWWSRYDATMPNGGAAWTNTRFDALQVGARHGDTGGQDTFISALMVMVAFYRVPGNPSSLASPTQNATSIALTWTKGTQADKTMVRYRDDGSYPTSVTNGTQAYFDTGTSTNVTGLLGGHTYKFRAWAYATPSTLYSTGTADLTQATLSGTSISNAPTSKAFGVVLHDTTYYAKGSAPANPVVDDNCTFTITNDGTTSINITIKATNFSGGVGWTLTSGAPGVNTVRITAYYSGQNPASGVVLTTSDQTFYTGLAASGTKKWDFKFETGSFTDPVPKSSTITLTATAS